MFLRKIEKALREKDFEELKKLEKELTEYLQREEVVANVKETRYSCSEKMHSMPRYDADEVDRCRRTLCAVKTEICKRVNEQERGE